MLEEALSHMRATMVLDDKDKSETTTEPKLLPPSADPLWPEDFRHDQDYGVRRVIPPIMPVEGESRFVGIYVPDRLPKSLIERSRLPDGWHLRDDFLSWPRPFWFRDSKGPRPITEFVPFGDCGFVVSERVFEIVQRLDPAGCEWIEVDYEFADGSRPAQRYFLFNIVRVVPAIDWANSVSLYQRGAPLSPEMGPQVSAHTEQTRLLPDIPSAYHFIRPKHRSSVYLVSRTFHEQILALKPKLKASITFPDPARYLI